MFKLNHVMSVQLFSENFHFVENHYNFRYQSGTKFKVDHVKTETYCKQSISYLGPKIWKSIPQEIRNVTTLVAFKTKIKRWKPICSCRFHVGPCYLVFKCIHIYICLFVFNFSQIDIYSFSVGSFILGCVDISKILYFPCQH